MTKRLKLPQIGRDVDVSDGKTLLESALEQGVPFPHSCGKGRCGECKAALLKGSVTMLKPYSKFALTQEEASRGLILACRAIAQEDVELAWLNGEGDQVKVFQKFTATVVDVERSTSDIVRIFMRPDLPGSFLFRPGQFAMLTFAGLPPRSYSMANHPDEQILEFHIRVSPGGRVSQFVYQGLKVGDLVDVQGPFGAASLRTDHLGPIVAVAGGSGLAPMKAICQAALLSNPHREVRLYHGVRTASDLYLEDLFRRWESEYRNFKFAPVLSAEPKRMACRKGLVGDVVAEELPEISTVKFYTAGPPIMVEHLTALLRAKGVKAEDVHADPFYVGSSSHQEGD